MRLLLIAAVSFALSFPVTTFAAAPTCLPYQCNDGTSFNSCTPDGNMINYFADPCLTHSGENIGQSFSDVPLDHPDANGIAYVKEKGIVSGYADGTFRPDQIINRAEFTKIVMLYKFGQQMIDMCGSSMNFTDVSFNDWFGHYICRGKDAGVIDGYPDGTFRPNAPINFSEAAKIIARTDTFNAGDPVLPPDTGGPWYERYVRYLSNNNAIPLTITTLDHSVTRGEMAEMIYRLKTHTTSKSSQSYESLGRVTASSQSDATLPVFVPQNQRSTLVTQDTTSCGFPAGFLHWTGTYLVRDEATDADYNPGDTLEFTNGPGMNQQTLQALPLSSDSSIHFAMYAQSAGCNGEQVTVLREKNGAFDFSPVSFCQTDDTCRDSIFVSHQWPSINPDGTIATVSYDNTTGRMTTSRWRYDATSNVFVLMSADSN
jgi:hypothetical protein